MLFSGAWGKMIYEKNLKQKKILWHCPFNWQEKEGLSLVELCVEKGEADFVQCLTHLGVRGDILNPITGLPLFINLQQINFIFVFFVYFSEGL